VKDSDFGTPIIAIVNGFGQFVPGHALMPCCSRAPRAN